MVGKQPEVTRKTRQKLESAFIELYREHPISSISVREITEKAGYNRATFYLYYDSVVEMRSEIEDRFLDDWQSFLAQYGNSEGALDPSRDFHEIFAMMRGHFDVVSTFLGPYGDPDFVEQFKDLIWPTFHKLLGLDLTSMNEDERKLAREFYLSGLLGMARMWLSGSVPIAGREYGEFAVGLITGKYGQSNQA